MSENATAAGFALLESVVALAVLAVAALVLGQGLGQSLLLAEDSALRLRESALRGALAADGATPTSGWVAVGSSPGVPPCQARITSPSSGWLWIEVHCGTAVDALPAAPRAPGLLVSR